MTSRFGKSTRCLPHKCSAISRPEPYQQHQEESMTKITYEIVEHDGGWAYRVDGVFSETFPSHDMARRAAERAAKEQTVPGDTTGISYEDKAGHCDAALMARNHRPETEAEG